MKKDKLFMEVCGKPLIYYSIMAYSEHPEIDEIYLVSQKKNFAKIADLVEKSRFRKVISLLEGGETRQKSLENAIAQIESSGNDLIIVHNGANPLPSAEEISEVIKKTRETGAAISGHYLTSTIKEFDNGHIIKTHDRGRLFAAETPQAATYGVFKKALKHANKNGLEATDEAMLLESIGQKISIVEADPDNFKITYQKDLIRLKTILGDHPADFRVGIGQDSHVFEESQKGLWLGGHYLPNELKLKANSDGDVILHAVFNSISQALGDKSLGFYADPMCEKGITDSSEYLKPLLKKLQKQKLRINSLGIMLECSRPKIDPLNGVIKKSLSRILNLPEKKIGITATTGENITDFGKGIGIQCFAIISLKSQN